MTKPLENIVVVGADVHAWTVALGLTAQLSGKGVSIKVVGKAENPKPGVLSLDASAHQFHQNLGLKEASLIASVGGSYRYGVQLDDAIFSFSPTGEMLDRVEFHHYVSQLKLLGSDIQLEQYSLTAQAALQGKFSHPTADTGLDKIDYNLQIDHLRYLAFLKKTAINNGVQYIDTDVVGGQKSGSEIIDELQLSSGESIVSDFIFDCTGVIFDTVLKVPFESFSDTLGLDRSLSWVATSQQATPLLNQVKCLQDSVLLTQPLPGGMAHTLSYDQQKMSDDQALEIAKRTSGDLNPSLLEYNSVPTQIRESHWVANAVAIANAAGSVGSVIFSQMYHTQTALRRWLELYPRQQANPHLTKQYNKTSRTEYLRVLDVHALALRPLTKARRAPATLEHRIRLFEATGCIAFYEEDVLDKHQWVNLLTACQVWPQRCDVMLAQQSADDIVQQLASITNKNQALIASMPSLDSLLKAIRQSV